MAAEINNPALSENLQNMLNNEGGAGFLGTLIGNLISIILIVAALAFFFMLVFGGIQWLVSGGDKAATESARGRITAALIGLIIVFAAWAIIVLVQTFLGITLVGGPIVLPKL